jgi:predicted metalloendopeptidase
LGLYFFLISELVKVVASSGWLTPPQKMNAFYTPVMNEIMIPLGILQSPFFDTQRPEVSTVYQRFTYVPVRQVSINCQ